MVKRILKLLIGVFIGGLGIISIWGLREKNKFMIDITNSGNNNDNLGF